MGIFRHGTKDSSAVLPDPTDAAQLDSAADPERSGRADPALAGGEKQGPFDRSDVGGLEGRLDLGSLWMTGVPGMELRLEVEQETQNVVGVTAVLGESAVQLQAFAAPRSEGIWSDIRTEIAASITSQGGTADLTFGPLGAELQARMPGQAPDGRTVFSPARFIGVDGPRWFLRAVLSGRAAIDEDAASALLDVVRATVVVRGDEAMAPRELLALRLPDQPDPVAEDVADEESAAPKLSDLNPFERGPEITEIH
ncbi:MAG: DUF3710 domain-containing protein [Dermatophilaceae bacterium]